MATSRETIVDLEKRFWQSMIDSDTDTALEMLSEPSTLVSTHGAMKFDHDTYRRMAESGDFSWSRSSSATWTSRFRRTTRRSPLTGSNSR